MSLSTTDENDDASWVDENSAKSSKLWPSTSFVLEEGRFVRGRADAVKDVVDVVIVGVVDDADDGGDNIMNAFAGVTVTVMKKTSTNN